MRTRFVLLTLIWGASFLFIKVGLETLAPLQVAFGRMLLGALTLLGVSGALGTRLPREPRVWAHLTVTATLANTIPFTLFAYAEQHISSALASIANAAMPLFTLLFALLFLPSERPTWRRAAGLLLGFVGVAVVLGVWRVSDSTSATHAANGGLALALLGAAFYGISSVYMRRYLSDTRYSTVALSTGQLVAGSVELGVLVLCATHLPTRWPLPVMTSIFLLGALGTGGAYVLNYGLIRLGGVTVASMVTYFIPLVSILIGVVGLHEELTWNAPVGAAIIVAGALVSRSRKLVGMSSTLPFHCRCGQLRGHAVEVAPATINHVVCYCHDCQAFAHWLDRGDLLDGSGGSSVVQMARGRLQIESGAEQLRCMRLSDRGLFRWYTECCRWPVGSTIPKIPFLGASASLFDAADLRRDVTGPVTLIQTHGATGPVGKHPRVPLRMFLHFGRMVIGWFWRRLYGTTFFDRQGKPQAPVKVLSKAERDALRPSR